MFQSFQNFLHVTFIRNGENGHSFVALLMSSLSIAVGLNILMSISETSSSHTINNDNKRVINNNLSNIRTRLFKNCTQSLTDQNYQKGSELSIIEFRDGVNVRLWEKDQEISKDIYIEGISLEVDETLVAPIRSSLKIQYNINGKKLTRDIITYVTVDTVNDRIKTCFIPNSRESFFAFHNISGSVDALYEHPAELQKTSFIGQAIDLGMNVENNLGVEFATGTSGAVGNRDPFVINNWSISAIATTGTAPAPAK